MKLLLEAAAKMLGGMLLMGLVLFLPAGTWHYPNGWLFCILLFLPMAVMGAVLFWKAPGLLEKRLDTRPYERKNGSRPHRAGGVACFIGGAPGLHGAASPDGPSASASLPSAFFSMRDT